jgi:hypothetical protein
VIVVPTVLLLLLVAVQVAVLLHGATVADAAAARGAAAGSALDTAPGRATEVAAAVVGESGSTLAAPVVVELAETTVRVRVTVAVPRILPLFPATVSRDAVEPRERFVPESER